MRLFSQLQRFSLSFKTNGWQLTAKMEFSIILRNTICIDRGKVLNSKLLSQDYHRASLCQHVDGSVEDIINSVIPKIWPRGYKTFSMLS